jgi:hypothetical protein
LMIEIMRKTITSATWIFAVVLELQQPLALHVHLSNPKSSSQPKNNYEQRRQRQRKRPMKRPSQISKFRFHTPMPNHPQKPPSLELPRRPVSQRIITLHLLENQASIKSSHQYQFKRLQLMSTKISKYLLALSQIQQSVPAMVM